MPLNTTGVIDLTLSNLLSYNTHISRQAQRVNDRLVANTFGASDPGNLSSDLLEFGKQSIRDLLNDEVTYVDECRKSLLEQSVWHSDSSRTQAIETSSHKKLMSDIQKEKSASQQKSMVKFAYYEPVRERLMADGFLVAPRGAALGAVFPVEDWVCTPSQTLFWNKLKERTDSLAQKYKLIGDTSDALTRMLISAQRPSDNSLFSSAIGCLCISWTRLKHFKLPVYIPVLGLSGVVAKEPDPDYFASYCRHLALPTWAPDPEISSKPYEDNIKIQKLKQIIRQQAQSLGSKGLLAKKPVFRNDEDRIRLSEFRRMQRILKNYEDKKKHDYDEALIKSGLATNYETMIERTNKSAVGYRARTLLNLRTPSRQALLSYVSFRENKAHKDLKIEELQNVKDGVDLWICGWHSLNCAEPTALMTASSLLGDGVDVLVCFPYEGFNDTGTSRNRPKETCPWCAAVELGFRSLTRNTGRVDQSISSGKWHTEFTMNIANEPEEVLSTKDGFDAYAHDNDIMKRTRGTFGGNLVKNRDLDTSAYSEVVETKIGRLRSMYHLLGLLDPEVVALNRPLFGHASPRERRMLF